MQDPEHHCKTKPRRGCHGLKDATLVVTFPGPPTNTANLINRHIYHSMLAAQAEDSDTKEPATFSPVLVDEGSSPRAPAFPGACPRISFYIEKNIKVRRRGVPPRPSFRRLQNESLTRRNTITCGYQASRYIE